MKQAKRLVSCLMAVLMFLSIAPQLVLANTPVATNVGWQQGRPGMAVYDTTEDMISYIFYLYKDGQKVYSTFGSGYDGTNYDETLVKIHNLGYGTYKFNIVTTDESGDFELAESAFSDEFVYKELPPISQVTNVQFNGYTATWDFPDDTVDGYYVDIRKDKNDTSLTGHVIGQVCYEKTYTIPEYTVEWFKEQGKTLDELFISIYALPKDRNAYNLSKSPYYSNKGGEIADINVNIQNEKYDNKCGENATWHYADGVLTISGTGVANDGWSIHSVLKEQGVIPPTVLVEKHEDGGQTTMDYAGKIKSIVVEEGITEISDSLAIILKNSLIPDSVTFPSTLKTLTQLPEAGVFYCYGDSNYWTEELLQKANHETVFYASQNSTLWNLIQTQNKALKQSGKTVFSNVVENADGMPKIKYGYSDNGGITHQTLFTVIDIDKATQDYNTIPQGIYKDAVLAVASGSIMQNIYNNYGTNITKADAVIAICQYISQYHALDERAFNRIYTVDTFSQNYSDTELDTLANNCARALRHWFAPESETLYGANSSITYGEFVSSFMSLLHDLAGSNMGTDAMSKAREIGALNNLPAYADTDVLKYEDVALILYNMCFVQTKDIIMCSFIRDAYSKTLSLTIGNVMATVNTETQETDAAPMIVNDRTMLPIRFVAENLGGDVYWNGDTRTVTIAKDGMFIEITIDSAVAIVNGSEKTLDSPAFIENGRTYLPVRFVSENLGATVDWDGATRTVTIRSK